MKTGIIFIGLLAGLLFGLATPLSKVLLSEFNSFLLAGLLYLGAALAFLPFIIKNGREEFTVLRQSGKKKALAGVIISGGMLGPLLLMAGLRAANAMSVSVWLNLELVATAVLGVLFFREHIDRFTIYGILFTLAAGILVSLQEPGSGIVSGFLILLACIAWGVDNHLTAVIDGVSARTITFIKGLFGGIINLSAGLLLSDGIGQVNFLFYALLIGAFSYGVSIVLYVETAQSIGATRSQILFSTAPFWGIIAAWILLREPIGIITIGSMVLLIPGIVFISFSSHGHTHKHTGTTHIHLHSHDDGHHDHPHPDNGGKFLRHTHVHDHKGTEHAHAHYPDLHHRHEH
ncbi:MAG: DMT family transporter [Bacteroidales bacterium]